MIDLSNLEEIYAHLEAHPPTVYKTCPCGVEVNSYTGWISHAILPLIAQALQQGHAAALNSLEPQHDPTDTDIFDDMIKDDTDE